jgi:mannose-6-phosphate isomerase-like protein (cupin superfamily)
MPSPDASFSIARNTRAARASTRTPPSEGPPAPSLPPPDPTRPLALSHLADIAFGLAWVPDLWRPFQHDDLGQRPATRLLATERWEAWLLEWGTGQSVELHDHGPSAGAFIVVSGRLVEVRPRRDGFMQRVDLGPGQARRFAAGDRHDVLNLHIAPAASIHVYSPPLTEMTFYDPISQQALRTETVEDTPVALAGDPAPVLHPSARGTMAR